MPPAESSAPAQRFAEVPHLPGASFQKARTLPQLTCWDCLNVPNEVAEKSE